MSKILFLGAESVILQVDRWGQKFVLKQRQKKPYLLEVIDQHLRTSRLSREVKMLEFARSRGVRTPTVYSVDQASCTIMMDFIKGEQLKELAPKVSREQLIEHCRKFGEIIAQLHAAGVVHGDPTTSNVIVDHRSRLWMIDFGLAEWNATIEMKGVDLHLIHRALETTHWDLQDVMLTSTLEGYSDSSDNAEDIISRMNEIRERGRYH
jgi:TP53 regulating kinase-like protein